ncbi:MAG: energy transducer TonB, partial [Pseudobdellovibrionaceae bacterium]
MKVMQLKPIQQSLLIHIGLLLVSCVPFFLTTQHTIKNIPLEVIVAPTKAAPTLKLDQPLPAQLPQPPPKAREVFGLSRKALTAETGAIEVKSGNTLAKEQDRIQLQDSDVDSLPIPSDEFLVNSMPRLKSDVRIPYPAGAKKRGVFGNVIMDLLIDNKGLVRQATLIESPDAELAAAA